MVSSNCASSSTQVLYFGFPTQMIPRTIRSCLHWIVFWKAAMKLALLLKFVESFGTLRLGREVLTDLLWSQALSTSSSRIY